MSTIAYTMMRYRHAATIVGARYPTLGMICEAAALISNVSCPTVAPTRLMMDVSLSSAIISLPMAGMTFLIACGKTILTIVCVQGMPSDLPASICPLSTDKMPARMFSETYAPELMPNVRMMAAGLTPGIAMMTNTIKKSCTATGVPRTTVV